MVTWHLARSKGYFHAQHSVPKIPKKFQRTQFSASRFSVLSLQVLSLHGLCARNFTFRAWGSGECRVVVGDLLAPPRWGVRHASRFARRSRVSVSQRVALRVRSGRVAQHAKHPAHGRVWCGQGSVLGGSGRGKVTIFNKGSNVAARGASAQRQAFKRGLRSGQRNGLRQCGNGRQRPGAGVGLLVLRAAPLRGAFGGCLQGKHCRASSGGQCQCGCAKHIYSSGCGGCCYCYSYGCLCCFCLLCHNVYLLVAGRTIAASCKHNSMVLPMHHHYFVVILPNKLLASTRHNVLGAWRPGCRANDPELSAKNRGEEIYLFLLHRVFHRLSSDLFALSTGSCELSASFRSPPR